MREQLINTLHSIGKTTELLQGRDGTTILVLPHGGRVLGLFSSESDENYFWTNHALSNPESARVLYESADWHNSGWDRTWLSPEVDFFFPQYPRLDMYRQPRALDPGNYKVLRKGNELQLVNRMTLEHSRARRTINLEITKSISPAPNPLRHERYLRHQVEVAYAGYSQNTSLEFLETSEDSPAQVGVWHLLQLPHGGELFIPTYTGTKPKVYFGTISEKDLSVRKKMIRYRMRAEGEHKLGVRAVASTGRVGYLYQSADKLVLVIRAFFVNPSGEYVDVPWKDPEDLGYSTQACNVNSQLGSFSELEYHVPAIGNRSDRHRCDDAHVTWAYRGSRSAIRSVASCLLGSDLSTW